MYLENVLTFLDQPLTDDKWPAFSEDNVTEENILLVLYKTCICIVLLPEAQMTEGEGDSFIKK